MSIYEYDEEKHLRTLQRESMEDGIKIGMEDGIKIGMEAGMEKGTEQTYYRMFRNHRAPQEISEFTGESLTYLYQIHEKYKAMVQEEGKYSQHE